MIEEPHLIPEWKKQRMQKAGDSWSSKWSSKLDKIMQAVIDIKADLSTGQENMVSNQNRIFNRLMQESKQNPRRSKNPWKENGNQFQKQEAFAETAQKTNKFW